jgi:uncharacterized C2H2 Zn-finger protein
MEYAMIYWVRHLEAGLTSISKEEDVLLNGLAESLSVFVEHYWHNFTGTLKIPKRTTELLRVLPDCENEGRLGQAIVSAKKQLKHFGEMRNEDRALDLSGAVAKVRTQIERFLSADEGTSNLDTLKPQYGVDLYKCPRFSCHYFTYGFSSESDRRKHVERHERPARCTDENCIGFQIGFATEAQLAKHIRDTHTVSANQEQEFPTEEEITLSIRKNTEDTLVNDQPIESSTQTPEPEESEQESESEHASEPETISNAPQEDTVYAKRRKRQQEFTCEHCGKMFKKQYNWRSHLASHGGSQRFECSRCGTVLARLSDFNRHLRSHSGGKTYVCSGALNNGQPWGCGKAFARADILRSHHKSKKGQQCLVPLQEQNSVP